MSILVTGGAGYIGSHTCIKLLEEGYDVIVVDNLVNSSEESLNRVQKITGKTLKFYMTSLLDRENLDAIFAHEKIDAVIHFAGLKAVGESVAKPLEYYYNNISGTLILLDVMKKYNCKRMVFSSSATVYGDPAFVPITEECPLSPPTNPYGRTKAMLEQILRDMHTSDNEWSIMLLRYFNPIGAHESGLIGEDPKGIPNNLLPYVTQVAIGKLPILGVFGNDYDTPDGTCIRDYIHVSDLAFGHIKALNNLLDSKPDVRVYNLGTGHGYSVMDVINAFEKANGIKISYEFKNRRPGDIPVCYADPSKAFNELGWKAEHDIVDMCRDAWNWQKNNPDGYR
ncbi:MAG: UDP-glucose 4-epimerase GalE [Lachnospiraceae bacterium]|nr:UDP-glucose 4-epimerase GalE [Lachnospiraceae bacterium]